MSDLRDQLQNIADKYGGRITPAYVVDEARPSSHPLHHRFEWDDRIAGEAHRRRQAQELIQSVVISHRREDQPDITVRAFHAIRDEGGYAYRATAQILEDPLMTRMLLASMERDWKALKARYEQFAEFRELILTDLEIAS